MAGIELFTRASQSTIDLRESKKEDITGTWCAAKPTKAQQAIEPCLTDLRKSSSSANLLSNIDNATSFSRSLSAASFISARSAVSSQSNDSFYSTQSSYPEERTPLAGSPVFSQESRNSSAKKIVDFFLADIEDNEPKTIHSNPWQQDSLNFYLRNKKQSDKMSYKNEYMDFIDIKAEEDDSPTDFDSVAKKPRFYLGSSSDLSNSDAALLVKSRTREEVSVEALNKRENQSKANPLLIHASRSLELTLADKKTRTKSTNATEVIRGGTGKESCKSTANITNATAASILSSQSNDSSASSFLSKSANSAGPQIQSATNGMAVIEHLLGFIANLFRRREAIKDIEQAKLVLKNTNAIQTPLALANAEHKLKQAKTDKKIGTIATSRYAAQLTLVSGLSVPRIGLDAANTASGASKIMSGTSGLAMACIAPVAAGIALYGAKEDRKAAMKAGEIKIKARELQHQFDTQHITELKNSTSTEKSSDQNLITKQEYAIIARMIKRKQSVWQKWTSFAGNLFSAGGYAGLGIAGAATFATTLGAAGIAAIPIVGWTLAGVGAAIGLGLAIHRYVKYRQHRADKILIITDLQSNDLIKAKQAHFKLLASSGKYAVHYLVSRLKDEIQQNSDLAAIKESTTYAFLRTFISEKDADLLIGNLKAEDTDAAKFVARKLNLPKIKYRSTTPPTETDESLLNSRERRSTAGELNTMSYI